MTTASLSDNASPNPAPAAATRKPNPSKARLALLMLVGVYPIITLYLYVLMPLTEGWALWQRTLILVPMMVLTIVFGIAPTIQKQFGWFVGRLPRPRR